MIPHAVTLSADDLAHLERLWGVLQACRATDDEVHEPQARSDFNFAMGESFEAVVNTINALKSEAAESLRLKRELALLVEHHDRDYQQVQLAALMFDLKEIIAAAPDRNARYWESKT